MGDRSAGSGRCNISAVGTICVIRGQTPCASYVGSTKENRTMPWKRITDPEQAAEVVPAWFAGRMVRGEGVFGFLLTTGDVLRFRTITSICISSEGMMLVDVLLDHAGLPDGIDLAWRSKHYLGAPVPGATLATVNAAQIVTAVEFALAQIVDPPSEVSVLTKRGEELPPNVEIFGADAVATAK